MAVGDPRSNFYDTVIDDAGNVLVDPDPEVDVFLRGTSTRATVYEFSTPGSATQKPNPFATVDGFASCWLEPGAYDIVIRDTNVPPRRGPRTIGFDSIPAAAAGIPSAFVMGDAGLPYAAFGSVAQRQVVPLGTVISWWRPDSSIAVPAGWAIPDGRTIPIGEHDFPGGAALVLPDLRNKFILGADSAKADGNAGTAAEGPTNAPGIRGGGGSNATKDLQHDHSHTHGINSSGSHSHTVNAHQHEHVYPVAVSSGAVRGLGPAGGVLDSHADSQVFHSDNNSYSVAVPLYTDGGSFQNLVLAGAINEFVERHLVRSTSTAPGTNTTGSHNHGGTLGNSASLQLSTANDFRPSYYGLLLLMKVRRA